MLKSTFLNWTYYNKAKSSVQQINTHKKAKSNSKYIDNSDSDLDLDNLEKDLARKTK